MNSSIGSNVTTSLTEKTCRVCSEAKTHREFYYGRAVCKLCMQTAQQLRYRTDASYRSSVLKRNRVSDRHWRAQHPDKVTVRAQRHSAAYRESHKSVIAEAQKAFRVANKDAVKAYNAHYRRTHKDKVNASTNRRRARLLSCVGSYTDQEWVELKAAYGSRCLCCFASEVDKPLTADHVIPLVLGGDNSIHNIQPLCRSCNSAKGIKTTDYRLDTLALCA